jgi:hypothetical protein
MWSDLPELHALIELAIADGGAHSSHVENLTGNRIVVAAPVNLPADQVPPVGSRATLRWPAGRRGRHAAPAKIVQIDRRPGAGWEIEVTGLPVIEQNRRYVRGGDGEPIRLRRTLAPNDQPVTARIVDVSERSVRARCANARMKAGDPVDVWLELDQVIQVNGVVLRVVERPAPLPTDVVVVYDATEDQAAAIRDYVMQQQARADARTPIS